MDRICISFWVSLEDNARIDEMKEQYGCSRSALMVKLICDEWERLVENGDILSAPALPPEREVQTEGSPQTEPVKGE